MNVGKNDKSLDFAIKLIDMLLDGELNEYAKGGKVSDKRQRVAEFKVEMDLDNGFYDEELDREYGSVTYKEALEWELKNRIKTDEDADYYLDEDGDLVMEKGGEVNEAYIDYMNKDKGFKTDRKYFKTYEDAEKWGRNEFDSFYPDMISYTEYETPLRSFAKGGEVEFKTFANSLPSTEDAEGIKVYNTYTETFGFINDDLSSRIPSKVFVSKNKNSESGKYADVDDLVVVQDKMAKGGRTISIVNDGVKYDKSKYKAVYGDYDKDGVVNIDDANPLNKSKKGKVEEIELKNTFDKLLGVKAELDTIMYDAVDTLDEKAPKGADIYARTKTPYSILKKLVEKRMLDPKKGLTDMIGTTIAVDNQKELVELRDKIDNGLLGKVLDRDDFYKRPNAGYRAYHYIVEYKGVPVEVQLKTKNMKKLHEVSHKAYKNGNLDAKSLDLLSKTFMKADKGDSKAKAEIDRLLKDKKQLISKITKD